MTKITSHIGKTAKNNFRGIKNKINKAVKSKNRIISKINAVKKKLVSKPEQSSQDKYITSRNIKKSSPMYNTMSTNISHKLREYNEQVKLANQSKMNIQEPIYDTIKAQEEPIYDTPKSQEEPIYDTPKSQEEPIYDTPKSQEEPIYDTPKSQEEPIYDTPKDTVEDIIYETMNSYEDNKSIEDLYAKPNKKSKNEKTIESNQEPIYERISANKQEESDKKIENNIIYETMNPPYEDDKSIEELYAKPNKKNKTYLTNSNYKNQIMTYENQSTNTEQKRVRILVKVSVN